MVRYTQKGAGKRKRKSHTKRTKRTTRKSQCVKCHTRVKGYKKYCTRCRPKKYRGGAKSGSYIQKPVGYSIGTSKILRGNQVAFANPPPFMSYN
jgi:hypothetical protein